MAAASQENMPMPISAVAINTPSPAAPTRARSLLPLPNLDILNDSGLNEKKSSSKKQRLLDVKPCPRLTTKNEKANFKASRIRYRLNFSSTQKHQLRTSSQYYQSSPFRHLSSPKPEKERDRSCENTTSLRTASVNGLKRPQPPIFSPINHNSIRHSSTSSHTISSTEDKRQYRGRIRSSNTLGTDSEMDFSTSKSDAVGECCSYCTSSATSYSSCTCDLDWAEDSVHGEQNETREFTKNAFNLLEKLGSGSFAKVYKVMDLRSKKLYALKKSRGKFRGKMDRRRKLEEVRKFQLIGDHLHCVKFIQAWEQENYLFIQTELCSTTLMALTKDSDNQCLSESDSWVVLVDMLHALSHLSVLNLVHLDIKPDNIFVAFFDNHNNGHSCSNTSLCSNDGCSTVVYKLGDFGLMISAIDEDSRIEVQEGDPKFLAIEVLSEVYTCAADVFSLGATLLDCVTSIEMPMSGKWWGLLRESLDNLPPQFVNQMSCDLFKILSLMMTKEHRDRPSAESLLSHTLIQPKDSLRQKQLTVDFGVSPMKRLKLEVNDTSGYEDYLDGSSADSDNNNSLFVSSKNLKCLLDSSNINIQDGGNISAGDVGVRFPQIETPLKTLTRFGAFDHLYRTSSEIESDCCFEEESLHQQHSDVAFEKQHLSTSCSNFEHDSNNQRNSQQNAINGEHSRKLTEHSNYSDRSGLSYCSPEKEDRTVRRSKLYLNTSSNSSSSNSGCLLSSSLNTPPLLTTMPLGTSNIEATAATVTPMTSPTKTLSISSAEGEEPYSPSPNGECDADLFTPHSSFEYSPQSSSCASCSFTKLNCSPLYLSSMHSLPPPPIEEHYNHNTRSRIKSNSLNAIEDMDDLKLPQMPTPSQLATSNSLATVRGERSCSSRLLFPPTPTDDTDEKSMDTVQSVGVENEFPSPTLALLARSRFSTLTQEFEEMQYNDLL